MTERFQAAGGEGGGVPYDDFVDALALSAPKTVYDQVNESPIIRSIRSG
jgi:hypothetical protein